MTVFNRNAPSLTWESRSQGRWAALMMALAVCLGASELRGQVAGSEASDETITTIPLPNRHAKPKRLPPLGRPTRLPAAVPQRLPEETTDAVLRRTDASVTRGGPQANQREIARQVSEPLPQLGHLDAALTTSPNSVVHQAREPFGCDSGSCDAGIDCPPHNYSNDFSPTPMSEDSMYHDGGREQWAYDSKFNVPTQHPWIEWGRVFYGAGITPPGINLWGSKNLARPKFYVYGDYRSGISTGRNDVGRIDNWANRLNLDFDLQLTDTERFHAFVGPLDRDNQFTRIERVDGDFRYRQEIDLTPVTGFFEGDLGVLMGTAAGTSSPLELPLTIGLVPLLFQNGIWMEDAVTGAAFALPARHSRWLNWSNYDATFFAVFDQLNSPAFANNDHAAQAFGTAWFIEAYGGYIESGYAYVRDRNFSERSYHNITTSFTRRYFDRISNSVRVIVNAGQDLEKANRTADGVLLLVENSWITAKPLTVVPYANFFVGWDRPQSVARAGVSGGILRNTGINFESDQLNGYPTLDPTANDTAGGAIGIDLLGDELNHQLLLELAYLFPHDDNPLTPSDQYAAGARYQVAISNWSIIRFDTMYGWRRGLEDVYGTRMEYRWKF